MAWNPQNLWKQPDDTKARNESGIASRTVSFKGKAAIIDAVAAALTDTDEIEPGWTYSSHVIRAVNGGMAILSITCAQSTSAGAGEEGGEEDKILPLKDQWSIQSVRNDVSIMAYCGPSEVANPNRAMLEAWMKEPDGELAQLFQFRKPDGSIVELPDASQTLAEKITKGIESVVRFYPVVSRTRTYSSCPPACLENLGFIDTPPAPAGTAKNPNGLSTTISVYQWLKVRDDAEEQTDGNWKRIESWWGIAKSDDGSSSPWDTDLYGANRWAMPYQKL